jgi:hypothetical protein
MGGRINLASRKRLEQYEVEGGIVRYPLVGPAWTWALLTRG